MMPLGFRVLALLGGRLLLPSHWVKPLEISLYHSGLEIYLIYLVYLKLTFVKPELSFQGNPFANSDHFDTFRNQSSCRVFLYAKDYEAS